MRLLRTNGGGEVIVSFAAMVMVECVLVNISILSKAAMSRRMSPYVFVVYYNALGTLFLLPSFVISQIKRTIPPLTYWFNSVPIQSAVITLIAKSTDLSVWRLKLDIELVTVVYSGVFGSVFSSVVHAWALHNKGPK